MAALPPGWEAVPDPSGAGDSYFWNRITNETTWERPTLKAPVADQVAKSSESEIINPIVFFEIRIGNKEAGRIEMELFEDKVPKTARNFMALCTGERGKGRHTRAPLHYKGCPFHRIIPGFMAQGGDFSRRNGMGGESIYGEKFDDEPEGLEMVHDVGGLLSMANSGPNTNGSQFFITFDAAEHLDGKHVVFGKVVAGMPVVHAMSEVQTDANDRPQRPVSISACGIIRHSSRRAPSATAPVTTASAHTPRHTPAPAASASASSAQAAAGADGGAGMSSLMQERLKQRGLLKAQAEAQQAPESDWTEVKTDTGEVYYWNKKTNSTTWDRPPDMDKPAAATKPGAAAPSVAAAQMQGQFADAIQTQIVLPGQQPAASAGPGSSLQDAALEEGGKAARAAAAKAARAMGGSIGPSMPVKETAKAAEAFNAKQAPVGYVPGIGRGGTYMGKEVVPGMERGVGGMPPPGAMGRGMPGPAAGKKRKKKDEDDGLDPCDPSFYSDAPRGRWSVGMGYGGAGGMAADSTASGPLFQQRPLPSPGSVIRAAAAQGASKGKMVTGKVKKF